jgi:hypothetical protein
MRVAQLLNIAFDMGACGTLYNCVNLCIRGNTSKEWVSLLKTVDIVVATPSILTDHEPEKYPSIKPEIVGGDPCPQCEHISSSNAGLTIVQLLPITGRHTRPSVATVTPLR